MTVPDPTRPGHDHPDRRSTRTPTRADRPYRVAQDRVVWREAGDETVVLDTTASVYFGLDRSGTVLWRRLAAGADLADLVAALTADAPVDAVRATADVAAFVDALREHGLIRPA
ncbi:PqqD family protein [Micromonospora echinospora]|uniref:PqqD family protein n=1 Tax=Micromonospora echinospora TaxID=1877 RepID=UPI0036735CAC